jgi:hypothetical protein
MPIPPIEDWVRRAASGDLRAFDEIVRRFQDMAVDYAHSVLGDFFTLPRMRRKTPFCRPTSRWDS